MFTCCSFISNIGAENDMSDVRTRVRQEVGSNDSYQVLILQRMRESFAVHVVQQTLRRTKIHSQKPECFRLRIYSHRKQGMCQVGESAHFMPPSCSSPLNKCVCFSMSSRPWKTRGKHSRSLLTSPFIFHGSSCKGVPVQMPPQ